MLAEIIKIHPFKKSHNGNAFRMVEFKLENGDWARTFLCHNHRNYARWRRVLREGNKVRGLVMKEKDLVDADSNVLLDNGTLVGAGMKLKWEEIKKDEKSLFDNGILS